MAGGVNCPRRVFRNGNSRCIKTSQAVVRGEARQPASNRSHAGRVAAPGYVAAFVQIGNGSGRSFQSSG